MQQQPPSGAVDLSPAKTTVAFDPIVPPLRIPVPAGPEDDPSKGRWVLAFKDENSRRQAWLNTQDKIASQCEMKMETCKEMITGKPAPLVSTFRLSYYTLLNLMSRAEGQFNSEHVLKNSFHQFQHEKALPETEALISKLEKEAAEIEATGERECTSRPASLPQFAS